jgi:hypothetical protein
MNANMKGLMAMLAMGAMFNYGQNSNLVTWDEYTPEELAELKKRQFEHRRYQLIHRQGLKEFVYPEITIVALNKKNADRKYQNILKRLSKNGK